jgi:sulfur carrier protein
MQVIINGEGRAFPELAPDSRLADLIAILGLKGDRVAVEHNGAIVPRAGWESAPLREGDKLEIVHFVGGGLV